MATDLRPEQIADLTAGEVGLDEPEPALDRILHDGCAAGCSFVPRDPRARWEAPGVEGQLALERSTPSDCAISSSTAGSSIVDGAW